jgi:hypothetical protein
MTGSNTDRRDSIPVAIRIGVIGRLPAGYEEQVHAGVRGVFGRLDEILQNTPHRFSIISSCSDDVFGLVAREALKAVGEGSTAESSFEAVLPISAAECIARFENESERAAFQELIGRAASLRVLEHEGLQVATHEQIGQHIIHSCDVLIAVWDGLVTVETGSTGQLVRYARMVGRTLFWVHVTSGRVTEERHGDAILESLEDLNAYNCERVKKAEIERVVRERQDWLTMKMRIAGLPSDLVEPLAGTLLPELARARLLADRYQRRYMWAGSAVYGLAALAVATITIQTLFFADFPQLIWLEVAIIAVILLLLMASRIGEWHRKWIDYRFLLERIRAAIFLSILCVRCEKPTTPQYLSLSHRSNDWMLLAFEGILDRRPLEYCFLNIPLEPLKTFLSAAWIDDRLSCYTKNSEWNRQRYTLIAQTSELLFAVTLVAAAIHAFDVEHALLPPPPLDHPSVLAAVTIVLPAIGAALAGIRVQREYLRNAERYAHMVRHLSTISSQIRRAGSKEELVNVLKEANEVTLREQQDWRVVFRFRELETP